MQTWALITQKGGAGKTTLATNLAVLGSETLKVLVIDLDPQQSAVKWYRLRESNAPAVVHVSYTQLDEALEQAKLNGFELVILDTAGVDSNINSKAAMAADFCLVPCQPSPADLQAQDTTVELMKRNQKESAFVLTRCPPSGRELEATLQGLASFGIGVIRQRISSLKDYQRAYGNGEGVVEYDPTGKAAKEIRTLFEWIKKRTEREVFSYAEA